MYALFLDHVVDEAHKISQKRQGRLDPPLTLILDEIANIFPWQRAAKESAEGSGVGVQLVTVFQTWKQAEEAYGAMANILKDNSTKILLGNSTETEFLKEFVELSAKRMITETSNSHDHKSIFGTSQTISRREVEGVTIDELRRLPKGVAAVLEGNMRLAIVDMVPYWQTEHATCIQASVDFHDANPGRALTSQITTADGNAKFGNKPKSTSRKSGKKKYELIA